jgi:hypothetical protein
MTDRPAEIADRPERKSGQEPTATLTVSAYERLKESWTISAPGVGSRWPSA